MKQTLYVLMAVSFLLNSCASIMNQPRMDITIYTTEPSKIIVNSDTMNTNDNKATFQVERKNEVINIMAVTDSLSKKITIEPENSFMYWSNIVCNYGIGMLVDKDNPKRYSYPQRIHINSADTISEYYGFSQANNKGELYLHLSLPHINSFQLKPENELTKVNTGFWGLTIGLDYYHSRNQFFSASVSGVSDFFVPIPAPITIMGKYELMSSGYFSLSNNHRVGCFTFGYGLSYARNTWDFRYDDLDSTAPIRDPVKRSHNALGLVFPNYFQLGEYFNIGVVYRPTFYRFSMTDNFLYEHIISLDFAWKIRL